MNITKIISKTFDSRLKQIDLYANQASEIIPLSVTMKISENVFLSKHTKKSNLM